MIPRKQKDQPLPEFVVWRANGEYFSAHGESLLKVAKQHNQTPEPGCEIVAIVELKYIVRPSEAGLNMQFAALSSRSA